ncbi:MAG: hypothetical protein U9Q61_06660 [Thermodesulfobacteriota bacterium]|nr:hypothetical protein [Thermodesulfobacteriota bacterium]
MKNKLWPVSVFLFGLILLGCQTTTTYYQGARADEEGVVNLSATQIENQRWQDLYVTVDYSFNRQGERFDIDGTLSFSDHPKAMYTRVPDLKLKLFFLDKEMRVVNYLDIARTLSTSLDDKTTFSRTLPIKEGVVSFTFGYEGVFIDDDPESPSSNQVWKLPKRNF